MVFNFYRPGVRESRGWGVTERVGGGERLGGGGGGGER